MRVKCLAQEHNTMSPTRARTRTARSGDERTNHEAIAPPVKTMTIPRLELTAATVSVRVEETIARESDERADSKTYWTDSTTVLKYIRNDKERFHVFWANRVQTIRDA